ncbi:MAG: T9SS type A sorting domain-containing protein [Bacteroidia bacterium]|nr:T9SS type A sorting domain-containing protein [Bacteroidia bacterium]
MKKKKYYFQYIRYFVLLLLFSGLYSQLALAQCTVVGNTSSYNAAYTQVYVLTDASGIILAQNSTGVFTTPSNGTFHIHALNYNPSDAPAPLPSSIIGQPISNVGSVTAGCFNSDFLIDFVTRICDCVQSQTICAGDPLIVSSPGSMSGYTQLYVLANTAGTIIATNATGDFTANVIAGNSYQIYALNYNPLSPPNPLPVVSASISSVGSMNQGCMNLDFYNDFVCYTVNNCAVCQQNNLVPQGSTYASNTSGYMASGYTQLYFLVDPQTNEVQEVNNTGIFTYNYPPGTTLQVYALNYSTTEPPVPLPVMGQNLSILGSSTLGCFNSDFNTDYVCNTVESPLPVESLNLKGLISGTTHVLNWNTLSEINNDYFELEWSLDNQNFQKINKQPGAGNSSIQSFYTFTHQHPVTGLNYYRVRQVDIGGASAFSNTVSLLKTEDLLVNLYPGPFSESLTVETEGATGFLFFTLYNELGQKVIESSWESSGFIHQHTLNSADLSSGVYYYKLVNGSENISGKILKK